MRTLKALLLAALLLVGSTGIQSCKTLSATPVPHVTMVARLGTPTSVTAVATFTVSTVGTPNGAIADSVIWTRGATVVRTFVTTTATTDSVTFSPRAAIGKADTAGVKVCAVYRVNSNSACSPVTTKIIPNADNQFPSIPIIVTVDTTKP